MRALETILDGILSPAAQNGTLTAQALATKAGLAAETVSRIRSRGTADYRSISKLAEAAGMELVVQVAARPRPVERNDGVVCVNRAIAKRGAIYARADQGSDYGDRGQGNGETARQ